MHMVMSKVLVLESSPEQRAGIVDALCELPCVDVRAETGDLASALRSMVAETADVIVAGTSRRADVAALLAVARECKLEDVVIHAPAADEEATQRWLACGASHVVVGSMDELAQTVGAVAKERASAPSSAARKKVPVRTAADELGPAGKTLDQASLAIRMVAKAKDVLIPTGEVVDLAETLRSAFDVYRRVIPDEVDVIIESASGTPLVRCNPRDIERLALRVVLAACEAMPWGGKVWLILEPQGAAHVRLEVIDTGSGVRAPTNDGVKIAASRRVPGERARLKEIETLVTQQRGSLHLGRADDGRNRLEIVFPAA
jgi:signal transduction histidine kinase